MSALSDLPNFREWSRATGGASIDDLRGPVVVVPPDGDPVRGLREAIARTTASAPARVVMHAATAPSTLGRVPAGTPLILTELDAYFPGDKGVALEKVTPAIASWLSRTFEGAIDGLDVSQAFWGSAATRFGFQDVLDAWVLAGGLQRAHPNQPLHLTGLSWAGAQFLKREATPRGLAVFKLRALVSAFASLGLRLVELVRERPTRRAIASLKAKTTAPRVWLGVIGHWPFSSRHVLGSLAPAARARGEKVGIVLESSLKTGALIDAHQTASTRHAILPVLDTEVLTGQWSHVDQVVSADSILQFLLSAPGTLLAMLKVVIRFDPRLELGPDSMFHVELSTSAAAALTLDVLRGREAAAATRRFVARHDVRNARVALSHASLVTDAVPDLILQRAGATTYDIVHGALAESLDMITTAKTFSTFKLLWTEAEAAYLQPHSGASKCIGAVPSRPWELRPRSAVHSPIRVLLMSNYATSISRRRTVLPRVGYQQLLLSNLATAISSLGEPAVVRWRPHPGDDKKHIELELERHSSFERSKAALDDDLEWADVIVTSLSSTVIEALAFQKPLLVHDIPVHEAAVLMKLFSEGRRFRNAQELTAALSRAVIDAGSPDGLEPEQTLRSTLFGFSGTPKSIAGTVFDG